ncbi:HalOD1 output domain-containing protein [Halosegnis marinus]|uniref:HalOD1 output domain-containing protein n=2 Tax=Halosegnis marinus TaxID=3034023 RepID=A0ABD5ZQM8_9EURY|nr:HalOD1 output domain-containing protein [Halosegnis sp. DT85]
MRVVTALAEALGRDATAIRPLGEVVDTDALDALFADGNDRAVHVSFGYEGFDVSVGEDDVVVRPATES